MPKVTSRSRFRGRIAGVGSTSGIRVVVGQWHDTPFGSFGDAMVETADGHRVLVAPTPEVRDFIVATYSFDEVRVEPIEVTGCASELLVRSPSLRLDLQLGGRTPLGWAIRGVPDRVATAPAWCTLIDSVARLVLRGVRTRGTAGGDRREWYGATDVHGVVLLDGEFSGQGLGTLRPVDPPCRFGFSSTPRRPSVTSVVTTVETSVQTDSS